MSHMQARRSAQLATHRFDALVTLYAGGRHDASLGFERCREHDLHHARHHHLCVVFHLDVIHAQHDTHRHSVCTAHLLRRDRHRMSRGQREHRACTTGVPGEWEVVDAR